jgi:dTDP-4-dehydrorhamnose 3,5-epimerase
VKIVKTELNGLLIINPEVLADSRGEFFESFNQDKLKAFGIPRYFPLEYQSKSKKGVIRGLHFQKKPFEQGKLVRVIKGKVLDVVLDIRVNSKTYGRWMSTILDDFNNTILWIPEGFAHGFLCLENNTIMHYKVTKPYKRGVESGVFFKDPYLNIDWQIEKYGIERIILSKKDKVLPHFSDLEN